MRKSAAILCSMFALVLPRQAGAGWAKFEVTVQRPAAVAMPGIKHIAVVTFHSPTGRFGTSVSSELQSRLVANAGDNFKIVDQTEVKRLLETQQAGASGTFDESTVAATGKLLGADALVFGSIDDDSKFENESVLTEVVKYRADNGEQYTEKCPTVVRSAHLGVTFKIVKVETGQVLAQTHKTYDVKTSKVNDPNPKNPYVQPGTNAILAALIANPFAGELTSDEEMQQQLAQQAAIDFSKMIMPYSEPVVVQWDTAVAPQDALKMLQATLFTEAREIMEKAVPELENDPKIAKDKHKLGGLYYDTGVAFELEGRVEDALNWYKKAIITGDNDSQVKDAIVRAKGLMQAAVALQDQTAH
jgi:tetratricopeptide (TPR) repeat protein